MQIVNQATPQRKIKIMKQSLIFIMLCFSLLSSLAQSTISAAGYEANGEGSMSATIGQVFFLEINDNGRISHGVQQTFIIKEETGIENTEIQLSAYPNPTNSVLNLQINGGDFKNVTYTLFNNESKMLGKGVVNDFETQILMDGFKTGVYFLDVKLDGKSLKRFKIIKN